MRFLSLGEVLQLYSRVMEQSGGGVGIRDLPALQSALAQPLMTFEGRDLYPTLAEKAAALGYSLVMNHPFLDGNKRTGHAAMEVFLHLNGHEITSDLDEQERVFLAVAAGTFERDAFVAWVVAHVTAIA